MSPRIENREIPPASSGRSLDSILNLAVIWVVVAVFFAAVFSAVLFLSAVIQAVLS